MAVQYSGTLDKGDTPKIGQKFKVPNVIFNLRRDPTCPLFGDYYVSIIPLYPPVVKSSCNQLPPEFCRMKLKRLQQSRSPGGTIVRHRNIEEEHGEGPTPMLTRALRRKFQVRYGLLLLYVLLRLPVL